MLKSRQLATSAVAAVLFVSAGLLATYAHASGGGLKVDRVAIKGDVETPLKLSAADLGALPQHSATVTFLSGSKLAPTN